MMCTIYTYADHIVYLCCIYVGTKYIRENKLLEEQSEVNVCKDLFFASDQII